MISYSHVCFIFTRSSLEYEQHFKNNVSTWLILINIKSPVICPTNTTLCPQQPAPSHLHLPATGDAGLRAGQHCLPGCALSCWHAGLWRHCCCEYTTDSLHEWFTMCCWWQHVAVLAQMIDKSVSPYLYWEHHYTRYCSDFCSLLGVLFFSPSSYSIKLFFLGVFTSYSD